MIRRLFLKYKWPIFGKISVQKKANRQRDRQIFHFCVLINFALSHHENEPFLPLKVIKIEAIFLSYALTSSGYSRGST